MKFFSSLLAAGAMLAALPTAVFGQDDQIVFDAEHNQTSIVGTWATGSRQVQTGAGFANPSNVSFIYPNVTGVSYSFTSNEDGAWFEAARYRFKSNATRHNCITGVMLWMHGHYELNNNGSITLIPNGDGYQQIQAPCAAVTENFIEDYNGTELFSVWRIYLDPTDGYKLHLFEADGTPVAPMFQVSEQPQMLPLQRLRKTAKEQQEEEAAKANKRSVEEGGNGALARFDVVSGGLAIAGVMSLAALVL